MDALWAGARVKLIGAGVDDARFAEDISRLVGSHDVAVASLSRSRSGRSETGGLRRQRILDPAPLRAPGHRRALLLASGGGPPLGRLRPRYREPGAEQLAAQIRPAEARLPPRRP